MTKPELEELLKSTGAPTNECTPEDIKINEPVRICFWEIAWEPIVASGSEYNTRVTYQVSVVAEFPRCRELLDLKHKLDKKNIHPLINHERDIEKRRCHSYFAIEVLENV